MNLAAEKLREFLRYDPETGIFTWLRTVSKYKAGSIAGTPDRIYVGIKLLGKRYPAHRLAWFYMTGEWPDGEIDHANRIGNDNRWCNLRLATRSQNEANKGLSRKNSSGIRGVCWHSSNKRWVAQISLMKQKFNLGHFTTKEEAQAAYQAKAKELFGEYNGSATP